MVVESQSKDGPDVDHDHDDTGSVINEGDDSGIDEDDVQTLTRGWVPQFKKGWLRGEALAYAKETHVEEFCQRNRTNATEGTAYGQLAAKDMIRVFGIFGPWGATSVPLDDEEEDQDDGRPYDDLEDFVGEKRAESGSTRPKEKSIQAREGELLKAAHIERFRKSFLLWLRYQYKCHKGGNTLRGRGNSKGVGCGTARRTRKARQSDDAEGEDLSRLLIHELLGLGHSTIHVPHAFQLWGKDQPPKFRKRFLKTYADSGRPKRKRAGAEMAYTAQKFRECSEDVQQKYNEMVGELKEGVREKKEALRERFTTRLEPKDAAKLLEAMPYILDPLFTSLSAMLHAKLSLLIGVPEPTEGGIIRIKSFDKGENHDAAPATFGQTPHYVRCVDAFKEFLNDAYTPEELRACAIPGSLPKSPKKGSAAAQRSDGKKVVIVVQSMALPEGDNWVTRKARLEDDEDDDEPTPIEMRRLRREKREAKAQQHEEDGPPAKRPRGRPRKRKIHEEGSEDDDDDEARPSPKKKKEMPETAKKTGRSKPKPKQVAPSTTTASGATTLGDITTGRGRKQPQPKISENRRKLLEMAAVVQASSQSAKARTPSPPPRVRKRKRSVVVDDDDDEDDVPEDPLPPPPRVRKRKRSVVADDDDDDDDEDDVPEDPLPRPRPLPRPTRKPSRKLTPVPEVEEHVVGAAPMDLGPQMDVDGVMEDTNFDLDVDEFEAVVTGQNDPAADLFSIPLPKATRTAQATPKTRPMDAPNSRVAMPPAERSRPTRIPPTGDWRSRQALPAAKPPSTQAMSVAPDPPPFNPFDKRGWSEWFTLCRGQFDCIEDPEWVNLLNVWTRVEGLDKFRVGKVILGYQSELRPDALGDWVNVRRKRAIVIEKKKLKSFAAEFWAWWIDLQPEWRDVAGVQGPLTSEDRPSPNGREWGPLSEAKGRNGIVSVIACLAWWGVHQGMSSGNTVLAVQWREAVDDVAYVLDGILEEGVSVGEGGSA